MRRAGGQAVSAERPVPKPFIRKRRLTSQDHPCGQQTGLFQAGPSGFSTPKKPDRKRLVGYLPTITTPSTKTRSQGILWVMVGTSQRAEKTSYPVDVVTQASELVENRLRRLPLTMHVVF